MAPCLAIDWPVICLVGHQHKVYCLASYQRPYVHCFNLFLPSKWKWNALLKIMMRLELCKQHHKGHSKYNRHELDKRVPNSHFQVFGLLLSTMLMYLHDVPQYILIDCHRILPKIFLTHT